MNDRGRTCRGNSGGLAKRNTYWHIFLIKYLHNLPCTFVIRLDDLEPAESRLVGSVHLPAPLSITSTTTTTTTTAAPTTTTEAAAGSFVVSYTSEAGVSADEDEELERILTDSTELPQEFLVGSVSLEELAEAGGSGGSPPLPSADVDATDSIVAAGEEVFGRRIGVTER